MNNAKHVFVIAEAGVNHNGSLARAKDLIVKAAEAGADGIKFQTYKADKLVTKSAPMFWNWKDETAKSQHEAYSGLDKFPDKNYPILIQTCKDNGIEFLSTAFDKESAKMLVKAGMKYFKVASSCIVDIPYLKFIAQYQLPIILSTGASTLGDIEEAVEAIEGEGNNQITLLQCTLKYPTQPKDANLLAIQSLKRNFPDLEVGLSDHTMGIAIPIAAAALGATMIEKHYTVDKTLLKSADHWLSVDPEELEQMVASIRQVEVALGTGVKRILQCERETYIVDKSSIVSWKDIKKGDKITEDMLICKRPGTGIRPKFLNIIVGRIATQDIPKDTVLTWDIL